MLIGRISNLNAPKYSICTLSMKLRNFQFKFLNRRIATNSFLFKIKFPESNRCCFCQSAQETLLHLFWECPITEAFWNSVQQFFVSVDHGYQPHKF